MPVGQFLKVYLGALVVFFAVDMLWLGVVAKGFYDRHLGHLLRPDVQWGPALLFYLIYVAALVVFVVQPALERASLGRAVALGAFFGFAAYAAFDLTSLALFRDFPATVAVVDMIWGAVLAAGVSAAGFGIGRTLG